MIVHWAVHPHACWPGLHGCKRSGMSWFYEQSESSSDEEDMLLSHMYRNTYRHVVAGTSLHVISLSGISPCVWQGPRDKITPGVIQTLDTWKTLSSRMRIAPGCFGHQVKNVLRPINHLTPDARVSVFCPLQYLVLGLHYRYHSDRVKSPMNNDWSSKIMLISYSIDIV